MSKKRNILDRFPRTLELLSNAWKNKEFSKDDIERHCDSLWGDDDVDCIRYQSKKLFDIVEELIEDREDIEDNMCRVYYNLETKELLGPYAYSNAQEDAEADKLSNDKSCILIFAK